MSEALHVVILAGGGGQRLWPWSRKDRPKPCLPLLNDRSLLKQTLDRASQLATAQQIHLVAGPELVDWAEGCQFLEEAVSRNTAPAIISAVTEIAQRDPTALVLVVPADHHVQDPDQYLQYIRDTIEKAASAPDRLWLFGTSAESDRAYGFIVPENLEPVSSVLEFVEKPAAADQPRLDDAGALRNCGVLLFRAQFLLDLVGATMLDDDSRSQSADSIPAISFDHFLLSRPEIQPHLMVVRVDPIWHDLGSWPALRRWHDVDDQGNLRFQIDTSPIERIEPGSPISIRAEPSHLESDGVRQLVLLGTGPLNLESVRDGVTVDMREGGEDPIESGDSLSDCQQLICLVEGEIAVQVISARGGLVAVSPDLVLVATEAEIGSGGLRDVLKVLEQREGECR